MVNTVPAQLKAMADCLSRDGWQRLSLATWVHPAAPALRLNTAYTHREATVTVDSACPGTRERAVLARYQGERALSWCAEHLPKINEEIFASLADMLSEAE